MKCTSCTSLFIICVYFSVLKTSNQEAVESHPIQSRFHISKMKREGRGDAIIFPEEKVKPLDIDNQPSLRRKHGVDRFASDPCPNNTLFCDLVDEYPTDQIKRLIKQKPSVLEHLYVEDEFEPEETDRFGNNQDTPLCGSRRRVIYPKKAKSAENVFEFVVNDDEHRQGVRVEECLNHGHECDVIGSILPFGYKSHCVQKFVTRSLVVAESSSGSVSGIVTKPFKIPSCCSCSLIVDHSGDRFGGAIGPAAVTTPRSKNATTTSAPSKKKNN